MHNIPDDLEIPEFLRRENVIARKYAGPRRPRKIEYPKDGYAMKGKRATTRERHRAYLRRRAEKMRQR